MRHSSSPFAWPHDHHDQTEELQAEKGTSLVLLPLFGTVAFYLLPDAQQQRTLVQFMPQLLAYLGFAIWACVNDHVSTRIGLRRNQLVEGIGMGSLVGLTLGLANTGIILYLVPFLGKDITFLTNTPHAQAPVWMMVPWTIVIIAIAVELNFRGFLLGRLITSLASLQRHSRTIHGKRKPFTPLLAILLSALVFAFDPFMVATFQHLHWIAVWDGLVWGWMWVQSRNLYSVITAHAVEVIVLYSLIKAALT
ncbi:MAG: CPBP family intramembrane metalloprotease [Nitrospirales bacterium]|nr:CPBP family intramembrane metalloprotease [Nitrospira sp.]MDR4501646.1 CPBP family intramembrane metalloprotease [Nitrospirales bacterium]